MAGTFCADQFNETRTIADLRSTLGPRFEDSVHTLIESGFIENVPDEVAAAKPFDVKAATRVAVRWLTDRLGPLADHTCLKIERAKNSAEFEQALRSARQAVQAHLGEAQGFDREVIDPLVGPLAR